MDRIYVFIVVFSSYFLLIINNVAADCPHQCICKKIKQGSNDIRAQCNGIQNKISTFDELDFSDVYNDLIQLDLSGNIISAITPDLNLPVLQKLDLSKNDISIIKPHAFDGTPNIRRLDLSDNLIKLINREIFTPLINLERLKLGGNHLTTIVKGTFDDLKSLKQLDISNNPLTCDCSILWLLDSGIKLTGSPPKCNAPTHLEGKQLKKLRPQIDFRCPLHSTADTGGTSTLEIKPDKDQIVFEGDTLKLHCRALSDVTYKHGASISWTVGEPELTLSDKEARVESRYLTDSGLVDSTLLVASVAVTYTGPWRCHLTDNTGSNNYTIAVNIVVISNTTKYCESTVTSDNKGSYLWPRTIAGFSTEQPCETQPQMPSGPAHIIRSCVLNNTFNNLTTSSTTTTTIAPSTLLPIISETAPSINMKLNQNLTFPQSGVFPHSFPTMSSDEIFSTRSTLKKPRFGSVFSEGNVKNKTRQKEKLSSEIKPKKGNPNPAKEHGKRIPSGVTFDGPAPSGFYYSSSDAPPKSVPKNKLLRNTRQTPTIATVPETTLKFDGIYEYLRKSKDDLPMKYYSGAFPSKSVKKIHSRNIRDTATIDKNLKSKDESDNSLLYSHNRFQRSEDSSTSSPLETTYSTLVSTDTVILPTESYTEMQEELNNEIHYALWATPNSQVCPYVSDMTRLLQSMSQVDPSYATIQGLLETVARLRNFSGNATKLLKDKMDVVFISLTLSNYASVGASFSVAGGGELEAELGSAVLDVVGSLMRLSPHLLRSAQREAGSASVLVRTASIAARYTSSSRAHKPNLAVEHFRITSTDGFAGLTCGWFDETLPLSGFMESTAEGALGARNSMKQMRCASSPSSFAWRSGNIVAAVHIPGLALVNHRIQDGENMVVQLVVTMFADGRLFPSIDENDEVVSAVVGVELVDVPTVNLSEPIIITFHQLQLDYFHLDYEFDEYDESIESQSDMDTRTPALALWDESKNIWDTLITSASVDGKSKPICLLSSYTQDTVSFKCSKLGHYSLILHRKAKRIGPVEDMSLVHDANTRKGYSSDVGLSTRGFTFSKTSSEEIEPYENPYGILRTPSSVRFFREFYAKRKTPTNLHLLICTGTLILTICVMLTITTYIAFFESIQMPKRAKHSLINTWLAIILSTYIYTFWIYETSRISFCRVIGLVLHYLTISVLLWIAVSISDTYKRLTKNVKTSINFDEDDDYESGDRRPIPKKPVIGLYFVGWGVALIVCGISGAVNMKEYASGSFCFLRTNAALSAVFVPALILVLFVCLFVLLIRCVLRSSDTQQLSEGTQATENVDLDLLERPGSDQISRRSVSTRTDSSSVEDSERGANSQVKAHLIVLVFYICVWFSAAFYTRRIFKKMFRYDDYLFSALYAFFTSILGLFILFFYGIARSDVRNRWFSIKNASRRSRNVSDVVNIEPSVNSQRRSEPVIAVEINNSRSSSRTSKSHNSNNILKAAVDLNGIRALNDPNAEAKIANVNLVVLHRRQYRKNNENAVVLALHSDNSEVFYNPHQSTVARKFFKRQRKHMMRRNDLGLRRTQGDGRETEPDESLRAQKPCSSDVSDLFGSGTKINNTNIHVESMKESKKTDKNVLHEDFSKTNKNGRFLRETERLLGQQNEIYELQTKNDLEETKKIDNNMRTVSQQCSLEYSSSDSPQEDSDQENVDLDVTLKLENTMDFEMEKENCDALPENNEGMYSMSDLDGNLLICSDNAVIDLQEPKSETNDPCSSVEQLKNTEDKIDITSKDNYDVLENISINSESYSLLELRKKLEASEYFEEYDFINDSETADSVVSHGHYPKMPSILYDCSGSTTTLDSDMYNKYQPSDVSNDDHGSSPVSAAEIEELYQQISRPKHRKKRMASRKKAQTSSDNNLHKTSNVEFGSGPNIWITDNLDRNKDLCEGSDSSSNMASVSKCEKNTYNPIHYEPMTSKSSKRKHNLNPFKFKQGSFSSTEFEPCQNSSTVQFRNSSPVDLEPDCSSRENLRHEPKVSSLSENISLKTDWSEDKTDISDTKHTNPSLSDIDVNTDARFNTLGILEKNNASSDDNSEIEKMETTV